MYTDLCFMNVSQWRMKQIESERLAVGRQVCVGLCLTLQNNKVGPSCLLPPPLYMHFTFGNTGNLRSVSIARKLKIKVCTNGNFVVVDS